MFISTVQESKTKNEKTETEYVKYTTPIPSSIIKMSNIKKGDKLDWTFDDENDKIIIEIHRG